MPKSRQVIVGTVFIVAILLLLFALYYTDSLSISLGSTRLTHAYNADSAHMHLYQVSNNQSTTRISPTTFNTPHINGNRSTLKQWNYVYVQHVRKSGGTSLHHLLVDANHLTNRRNGYPSSSRDMATSFRTIKQNVVRYRNVLIETEYFPFYTSSYLKHYEELWSDVLLVTLIRHPLHRIFSDLIYQGSWKCGNINYGRLASYNVSVLEQQLIECVRNRHAKHTSNVYCKVFSGVWPYANPSHRLETKGVDFNGNITITSIHYELAKLVLNEFDVLLVLELWEETKPQLKCHGFANDTLLRHNAGGAAQKLDLRLDQFPNLKDVLIELNQYDLLLYEDVKQFALRNVKQCGPLYEK